MSTIAPSRPTTCYGFAATKPPSDGGADRIDGGPAPGPQPALAPSPAPPADIHGGFAGGAYYHRSEPAPAPAPSADIDFSNIDSPAKAALLPVVNATTLLITAQAFNAAVNANLALDSALSMTIGASQKADVNYSVIPQFGGSDPSTLTMQAAGAMGNAPFKEDWTFNPLEGYVSIDGIIGGSQEALKLTETDHGNRLDGTIGKLAIHEVISGQGEDDDFRIVWDGTLGDQKIHQELGWKADDPVIQVNGTLGDAPITMDTVVTPQPDKINLSVSAQGNIAGTALSYTQSVKFSEAAPTPQPEPDPTPDPAPDPTRGPQ